MLAADLAAAGLTVVSGLARGIDSAAHEGALDAAGRTVAVLGCGIDSVYPRENAGLARAICARGAVVSEFPPGTGPWKQNFPRRNRTIAGWCRATVVVEAGERSGSLHTARTALEEGREVMAVPGHPSLPGSAGTNALLRDGAALVRSAEDVLREIGLEPRRLPEQPKDEPLLRELRRGAPCGVDELVGRCGRPLPELLARLSELELAGLVRRLPGALFVRTWTHASDLVETRSQQGRRPGDPPRRAGYTRRMTPRVTIVGGGLAGCEAAWQLARRGVAVDLYEMRPGAADAGAPDGRPRRARLLEQPARQRARPGRRACSRRRCAGSARW